MTTRQQVDELIRAIDIVLSKLQPGEQIGAKTANDLNKILRQNGKIKYINGNSGAKALMNKKNGAIAVLFK